MFKGSWQTNLTGLGAILTAVGQALAAQFDNNPETTPDWGLVVALIIAGIGLMRARDNNKTSEQVGAITDPTTSKLLPATPPVPNPVTH